MLVDARSLPDGTVLDADLAVIGAGAAGITLARAFAGSRLRVALVESGAMELDPETQQLYAGSEIGRPYLDLTTCRLRYFGGTTNHWGGWCLPLDTVDFEERDGFPLSGWPFDKAQLDPWYAKANEVCALGPYDFTPARFGITAAKVPAPFKGPVFANKIFQISPVFFRTFRTELEQAAGVTVYLNANAVDLTTNDNDNTVEDLKIATVSGNRMVLRARAYVLAAGGIENARIMLSSGKDGGPGIGNEQDLVGRFFMVHLTFVGGAVALGDPYVDLDFVSGFPAAKPWPFFSYVGLSDDAMRSAKLPNIRIMGEYKFAGVIEAVDALRRLTGSEERKFPLMSDLLRVIRDVDGLAGLALHKALGNAGVPVEALILNCNTEQLPNRDSRVLLGTERDAIGMRKVLLDWRVTADDKRNVNAVFRVLGAEIGRAGFGRLKYFLSDDDITWPEDLRGNEHHMGTTRMHRDPARGVVDENCRVHGIHNLFVAGSSVFPTGGATNPTLTIVALALRLAAHLKEQLA